MLRLAETRDEISVVADQIGSPTNAADLAEAILNILPQISNETVEFFITPMKGCVSWYDFAKAIFEIKGISIKVNPIESKQYPTPAERPLFSVLNKNKINNTYKLVKIYWKDSLRINIT